MKEVTVKDVVGMPMIARVTEIAPYGKLVQIAITQPNHQVVYTSISIGAWMELKKLAPESTS